MPAPPRPDAGRLRPPFRPPAPLLAALEIARPQNCAIAFASVLLGGWLGIHTLSLPLLLAALAAALITGGGNVHNDLCDIETDRINRPGRPLPSGRLSIRAVRVEAFGLFTAGIGAGLLLPLSSLAIALIVTVGLALYNTHLKRVPLAGNLLVGLLGGLAFIYGGTSVNAPVPASVPAFLAAAFHFGRELIKDVEDMAGDRLLRGGTLALRWGPRKVYALVTATYTLLILSTPLPVLFGHYGALYLTLVCALDILLVYVLAALWRCRTPERLRRLNRLLKIGMVLGLCAIFLDRL